MKYCGRMLIKLQLSYAVCVSARAFEREMKRLGIKRPPDFLCSPHANATTHFFESRGEEIAIVCVGDPKGHSSIEIAGLLVHEAVHIWQTDCDRRGERTPSAEYEAYAIQWISQQLLAAYAKLVRF